MRAFFMSMDGRYAARSQGWWCCACPWMDGMQQGARDGDAAMSWMDGMQQVAGAAHAIDERLMQ